MSIILSAIGQGLLWGLLGLGLYLTFRILDFPDLTVEGTFPLGACVCVAAITHGLSPFIGLLLSLLAGALAGLATGLLYTKLNIPNILAGILVMTGMYSIDLRILGRSNVGLLNYQTFFNYDFIQQLPDYLVAIVIGVIFVVVVITLLTGFINTDLGQAFVATGDNERMAASFGINTDNTKILGLMVSNGIIGLAGGMIAQHDGYADVNMGIGTIVIGLAAIIIGEVLLPNLSLSGRLIAIIIGSIAYRFVILIVLQLGFNTNDTKLLSAIILALCLAIPVLRHKLKLDHLFNQGGQKS